MKNFKITLSGEDKFSLVIPAAGEEKYNLVIPSSYKHFGGIVIEGLVTAIEMQGNINMILSTVVSALGTVVDAAFNGGMNLAMQDLALFQEIILGLSHEIGLSFEMVEIPLISEIELDCRETDFVLKTNTVDIRAVRPSFISDWAPYYMSELVDENLDEMAFTEVV